MQSNTITTSATPEQLENIGAIAASLVQDDQAVGLGSGKAAQAFVRMLGKRIAQTKMSIVGVPTSEVTAQVARQAGVPLTTLEDVSELDIAVDGADEVDPHLNLLKGGGGDLLREKVVASIARRLVIVVGQEKLVPRLGTRFPVFIEVVQFAMPAVIRTLSTLGASATPRRRPDGALFLTDNGNPLLHAKFDPGQPPLSNPAELEKTLHSITGVIDTGLFIGMAHEALVARFDGSVERLKSV
ncbi:MAG TPA: ribose-5-phosphate isomerase RpiA [Phycisphaerae bacterium]|nr:ribose-5-phosphate isomerase RpiA [Phycisphaerae bacterium]